MHYIPIIDHIDYNGYPISILRLDLLHPEVSGNKWFKLKYNLQEAKRQKKNTILTFGGAFSNHIAATAFACKDEGFKSIGIIRGEESSANNPTLSLAKKNGMELRFVSREIYKQKHSEGYLKKLQQEFPDAFIVPEGGDNSLGQQGCKEIIGHLSEKFTTLFCAYGTGTTARGIAGAIRDHQQLIAINVLKYEATSDLPKLHVNNAYHFGGYAKHTQALLEFKTGFEKTYAIELDYVYTAKLMFAVIDMIKKNEIPKTDNILVIHSGGLQGNRGYEERYNLNPSRQVNDAQG